MTKITLWAALALLPLTACNSADASSDSEGSESSSGLLSTSPDEDEAEAERKPFDEARASDAAEEEVSGESYTGLGSPYGCTDDCSGHEAGFKWRAEKGHQGFSADSPSFNEGGQAFEDAVEEKVEERRTAREDGEEVDY